MYCSFLVFVALSFIGASNWDFSRYTLLDCACVYSNVYVGRGASFYVSDAFLEMKYSFERERVGTKTT